MSCILTASASTNKFNEEFNKTLDKVYAVKHLLAYNRDHVDYLTHIFKQLNAYIELYYDENVFTCINCGELSVLNRICPVTPASSKLIIPKCQRLEKPNEPSTADSSEFIEQGADGEES